MKTKETYFIASVKLYQIKTVTGGILTKDGETGWLGECEWGPQVVSSEESATQFKTKPTASILGEYDGMPWYCRIKPDSLKVYKVTEETTKIVHKDRYLL